MTQNITTADIYTAITGNRAAFKAVNAMLRDTSSRTRRIAGRATSAAEVERCQRATIRNNAAIFAFIKAVRAAKAEARVEAAIATLKNRTGLSNANTTPAELATALRNA